MYFTEAERDGAYAVMGEVDSVCVMCVCVYYGGRESVCVCVCVLRRQRECVCDVCMCVYYGGRECVSVLW